MPRTNRLLMQQAYAELKRRIVTLELEPGKRIDDNELSAQLALSRTPVREAIFRLGAEGLIDISSKAGFVVKPLDLLDIMHLFEAHMVIAKAVARITPYRATQRQLGIIRQAVQDVDAAIARRDCFDVTSLNARLHQLEAAATHNNYLQRMAAGIHDQGQRLAYLCFGGRGTFPDDLDAHFQKVSKQHHLIFEALETRNSVAAERLAVEHVRLFRERVEQFLRSTPVEGLTFEAHDFEAAHFEATDTPIRRRAAI